MRRWLVGLLMGLGVIGAASLALAYVGNWFIRKSLRGPQMVCWVTSKGIRAALATDSALATLPLYSAGSVKITSGYEGIGYRQSSLGSYTNGYYIDRFFQECDAARVSRCGWGYHYLPNVDQARTEGAHAAHASLYHEVKAYSCNAEVQWLKGRSDYKDKPWMKAPHLRATLLAFEEAFRSVAPGIRLNVCAAMFSAEAVKALDPHTMARFDGMERMCFGGTAKTRRKQYTTARDAAARARQIRQDFSFQPIWASGSVESKMTYAGVPSEVLQLEAEMPTGMLAVYYGNYAGMMWAKGNAYSPSWAHIIGALQGRGTLTG